MEGDGKEKEGMVYPEEGLEVWELNMVHSAQSVCTGCKQHGGLN